MPLLTLRSDVEGELNKVDPVGARLRKLKKRLVTLEAKGTIKSSEYKEVSTGWLRVKELESQRNDFIRLQAALDPVATKLIRLSKNYDKLAEQYDNGKLDEALYEESLRKMYARLQPATPLVPVSYGDNNYGPYRQSASGHISQAMEQGCMAMVLIFIIIPALFSCAFH